MLCLFKASQQTLENPASAPTLNFYVEFDECFFVEKRRKKATLFIQSRESLGVHVQVWPALQTERQIFEAYFFLQRESTIAFSFFC